MSIVLLRESSVFGLSQNNEKVKLGSELNERSYERAPGATVNMEHDGITSKLAAIDTLVTKPSSMESSSAYQSPIVILILPLCKHISQCGNEI
jgi:hypothetical protein